jgi:hypothetical protein
VSEHQDAAQLPTAGHGRGDSRLGPAVRPEAVPGSRARRRPTSWRSLAPSTRCPRPLGHSWIRSSPRRRLATLGLGKLYRRTGKREQAQEHLATATTMYREMGMTYWLEKAEAAESSVTE